MNECYRTKITMTIHQRCATDSKMLICKTHQGVCSNSALKMYLLDIFPSAITILSTSDITHQDRTFKKTHYSYK